jgi:mRNA-degrading endonuclease RelE of RelBE toxin-antitoxin system
MVAVRLTDDASAEFVALPSTIKARLLKVFERLQQWPRVSGAKPLKREWAGHYRIRTGDWRVIFRPVSPDVIVVRIKHRSEVYDD